MNKLLCILIALPIFSFGQKRHQLSGYIEDRETGERLIGATVLNPLSGNGTASNAYGFFSLEIPAGNQNLEIRFVGYNPMKQTINIQKDTLIVFALEPGVKIDEVVVKGHGPSNAHPELSDLSHQRLDMATIEKMPVILGERDVLKSIQYLPGVKGGRENTASYNVRGGSADQNLLLLDGVPVYNVYHVFGFFSTFNNDAIKNASFYKGGIPARFGGRLSSVLDVTMKDGNMRTNSGVFSLSPVSARITCEAPIKKDTASWLISFRRSFLDVPMLIGQMLNGSNQTYGFKFYDLNLKANWKVNENNRLYWSVYSGRDRLFHRSKDRGELVKNHYQWGNLTSVVRWNKIFSPKVFANFSAYYSQFKYDLEGKIENEDGNNLFKTNSQLLDFSFKADLEYYLSPSYTLRMGSKASHLIFKPNIAQTKGVDYDITFNEEYENKSDLLELYLENELSVGAFNLNAGARFSEYFSDGKSYFNFQPRLALGINLGRGLSVNASYMKMAQYLHLLTNSSMGMPTDLWVASTGKVQPEKGWQVSLGLEKRFNPTYKAGVEGYYKSMKNVIRFREGETFVGTANKSWEESIWTGNGRAYGGEFFLKKEKGRLTGMLSYCLSWSERQFDEVNNGNWFPFKYDRRHDVSLLVEYDLAEKYKRQKSLSFGFTFQTGNHLSIPDSEQPGVVLPGTANYASPDLPEWFETRKTFYEPNNFKMPAFHHLDIGYTTKLNRSKRTNYTWAFSLYNAYNQMNPWYYKKQDGKVKSVSIFPVIPSVSFTYRW